MEPKTISKTVKPLKMNVTFYVDQEVKHSFFHKCEEKGWKPSDLIQEFMNDVIAKPEFTGSEADIEPKFKVDDTVMISPNFTEEPPIEGWIIGEGVRNLKGEFIYNVLGSNKESYFVPEHFLEAI